MISCIAIDDEKYALDLLIDNIRRAPFLELKETFRNGVDALHYLEKNPVDLAFLDIQMPVLNGLQMLRKLQVRPMIVIVSAFKSYALESFELDVLDYLLKPVSYERFLRAANKANDYFQLKHAKNGQRNDYIFVNADYRLVKINIDKILYIEGMKDYVKIFPENSKAIVTKLSLKTVEEMLPDEHFIRVHKSYIINSQKVISLQKKKVQLNGDIIIPLSSNYRSAYNQLIESPAES
ncbi:LytR/AlgR family response regulator transcription factor [Paludibacter jiangxiensis]|uniref:DNA-binding response regulator, LytR/AlgR family n=1 Tax=Paludibacter jiangxiensis TaxID=681398 RepID=A0A161L7J0_9BACT|nr:LytTR family DNA-binding domain-containing protein [Paludibacter jiangxiensis]GAT62714.1 DNA-binding response regulator, LytR/AlgR family [Paludibacter jiangxiensis]